MIDGYFVCPCCGEECWTGSSDNGATFLVEGHMYRSGDFVECPECGEESYIEDYFEAWEGE